MDRPGPGEKLSKEFTNYRFAADQSRRCGVCKFFERDTKTCKKVAGTIREIDTCDLFEPKSQQQEESMKKRMSEKRYKSDEEEDEDEGQRMRYTCAACSAENEVFPPKGYKLVEYEMDNDSEDEDEDEDEATRKFKDLYGDEDDAEAVGNLAGLQKGNLGEDEQVSDDERRGVKSPYFKRDIANPLDDPAYRYPPQQKTDDEARRKSMGTRGSESRRGLSTAIRTFREAMRPWWAK